MNKVKIFFEKFNGPMLDRDCYVLDMEDNVLCECEQGEYAVFECAKSKKIKVKMTGFFNKPKIEVEPGKSYYVGYGKITYLLNLPQRIYIEERN